MNSSVLVLAHTFPPYSPSHGWSVRAITLSHFLRTSGNTVHVLASKGAYHGYGDTESLIDSSFTHYLEHPARARFEEGPKVGQQRESFHQRVIEEIAVPDREIRILPAITLKAYQLIRKYNIGHLITTSPPHSSHLTGLILKKLLGKRLNWIVDYRDSWNRNPKYAKKTPIPAAISNYLEERVLKTCDHFTFVSPPILKKLEPSVVGLAAKARLVMNGFWEKLEPGDPPPLDGRPYRVGYFGHLSGITQTFERLVAALYSAPDLERQIEFHIFGGCPDCQHPSILVHQGLTSGQALERMTHMDYLLLFYSDPTTSDEVLTGKLFEYLAARRPILCLTPPNTEARRMVERYDIGLIADIGEIDDILRALRQLKETDWDDVKRIYRHLPTQSFHRSEQYKQVLDLLAAGPSADSSKGR